MCVDLIQAMCTYETIKNERKKNQAQEKTTGTKNQNLLKIQTLTLTEKEKNSRNTS
jgi:hypothetical protein